MNISKTQIGLLAASIVIIVAFTFGMTYFTVKSKSNPRVTSEVVNDADKAAVTAETAAISAHKAAESTRETAESAEKSAAAADKSAKDASNSSARLPQGKPTK